MLLNLSSKAFFMIVILKYRCIQCSITIFFTLFLFLTAVYEHFSVLSSTLIPDNSIYNRVFPSFDCLHLQRNEGFTLLCLSFIAIGKIMKVIDKYPVHNRNI